MMLNPSFQTERAAQGRTFWLYTKKGFSFNGNIGADHPSTLINLSLQYLLSSFTVCMEVTLIPVYTCITGDHLYFSSGTKFLVVGFVEC